MKIVYLLLSIVGFAIPNFYVAKVTIETGNIWMLSDPVTSLSGMFANDFSTAFIADVLWVGLVFMIWTTVEARRLHMRNVWLYWLVMLAFGLGGTLPLFLYFREKRHLVHGS
jgi:hypothetical protein